MGKKAREIEPYVQLDWYMTETAAWTTLSDRAVWLYIELKKSFKTKLGGNDHLVLPYRQVRWRMSTGSYCKGTQELIHYGFIRVVEKGGLPHRATIYALSESWKEISRKIVDKEGKEAIRLGLALKRRSWNRLQNLNGKQGQEDEEHTHRNI